jgi:hemolysin-activating ACP:hemolysin acyltransferase
VIGAAPADFYRDFEAAVRLWATVEPYSGFPAATIAWRLLPAMENGKYMVFWRDEEPIGLVTWGFFTKEEYETREYSGPEVFKRDEGDHLVVVELIVPGGASDVLLVCRHLRRFFKAGYGNHRHVLAHRGHRNGVFPNKGG